MMMFFSSQQLLTTIFYIGTSFLLVSALEFINNREVLKAVYGKDAEFIWHYSLETGKTVKSIEIFYGDKGLLAKYSGGILIKNSNKNFEWFTENAKYKFAENIVQFTIPVYDYKKYNGTSFTCAIQNEDDYKIKKEMELHILYPPFFSPNPPHKVVVNESQSIKLLCNTMASPTDTKKWYKDGMLLSSADNMNNLPLVNTNHTNAGNYTCIARNAVGSVSHSVIVVVQYEPKINRARSTQGNIGTYLGNFQPIALRCIADGVPSPKYTWTKDRSYEVGEKGTYLLTNPSHVSFGMYVCEASNALGFDRYTVNVIEIEKPKPVNITITDISSSSAYISISPVTDMGKNYPKAMVISYRGGEVERSLKENVTRRYKLISLKPHTVYEVNVTVLNEFFESDGQKEKFQTAETAPTFPLNVVMFPISSTSMNVTWQSPQEPNGVIVRYTIKFYEKNTTLLEEAKTEEILPHKFHKLYDGLKPYTLYVVTLRAATKMGDGPWTRPIEMFTDPNKPGVPRNISVKIQDSHIVNILWLPPAKISKAKITKFRLEINCTSDEDKRPAYNSVEVNAGSNTNRDVKINSVLPYSRCLVFISEGAGLKPIWSDYSLPYRFKMPEGAPTRVRGLQILGQHYDKLHLKWQKPLYINGVLSKFTIQYKNSSGTYADILGRQLYNTTFYYTINFLKPSTKYTVSVTAHSANEHSEASDEVLIQTGKYTGGDANSKSDDSNTVAVLASVFSVVFFIVLIILGVVLFMRISRRKQRTQLKYMSSESSVKGFLKLQQADSLSAVHVVDGSTKKCISMDSLPTTPFILPDYVKNTKCTFTPLRPIPITSLKEFFMKSHGNKDKGFIDEFRDIKPPGDFTYEVSNKPENKCKNRYANILAYDHSRVVLNTVENLDGSDYVNANYIDGYNRKAKFIATQGPVVAAFHDFWRMVWEQNTATIVMVTNLVERSRIKCQKYWPSVGDKVNVHGNIHIVAQDELELSDYVVRRFKISLMKDEEEVSSRQVTQYQFLSWPDHGVPQFSTALLQFVKRIRSLSNESSGPIVCHCSAGVGRTGTYITIDAMLDQIEAESEVDVLGFVTHMRTQRNLMVQTEAQYVFLFKTLLEAVLCGDTEVVTTDLASRIKHLNSLNPGTTQTYLQEEFERLEMNMDSSNKYVSPLYSCNKAKNRFLDILPYESTRVKLWPYPNQEGSDYMNASFIDGYQQREAYILTQAPLENTVLDFWRMLWEYEVFSVVMLSSPTERDMHHCYPYWPVNNESTMFGLLGVQICGEEEKNGFIHREFRVTNSKNGESRVIAHFMYFDWLPDGAPDPSNVNEMIGQLQKSQQQTGNSVIVIHCSDGSGRSGVLATLMYCLERLKLEGVVDVFQTVRSMRTQRTALVQTLEQYQFIYKAIRKFLDCFSDYANFK